MDTSPHPRSAFRCALLASAMLLTASPGLSQTVSAPSKHYIPPPLSVPAAGYFETHPAAYAQFLARLPTAPSGQAAPGGRRFVPHGGGSWQAVTPAPAGLTNALLLTDGTVIAAEGDTPYWFKLTPDSKGNYARGTWSQLASLPKLGFSQYAPLYHASAVLPDGRVIIMGGEYDDTNFGVWTNQGAIYDPLASRWTAVMPPSGSGWTQVGDAQSVMLANGRFLLASCCGYPAADALFDPKTLTWTPTAAPALGGNYQDEQGYELLPNGRVLTIDIWTNYPKANASNAELYDPASGTWSSAGNTPVSLPDPAQCGTYEIGPAVLRGDGTVVAFGGNTGCIAGATADPTAIYDSRANSWTAGPTIPAVCGAHGLTSCDLADAPAALLPDGNVLFAASAGYGLAPTHFFEFTPANTINQVADTLHHANTLGAFLYNFLVLPTGQILSTDFSRTAEIYTQAGKPIARWAPVIEQVPSTIAPGGTYSIAGAQLSGRSAGAYYGDDSQTPSNFPIVRITNTATGDVAYARTFDFSTMSVAPGTPGTTKFSVPAGIETGSSTLEVVADGIASAPVPVDVN